MKGGDVIVIEALRALHATGALKGRQVIVVFTGDEEDTGVPQSESRKALFEAAARSDVALAFEGAAPGVAVVGRRGIGAWRLHVTGEQAHSSGIFRESRGYGAIFETARILDRFRIDLPEQYLTYNPSVMVGGTNVAFDPATSSGTALGKTNVIPREAYVTGDIRFLTAEQFEATRTKMETIVAENLPKTSASIEIEMEYPSMAPTDGNRQVLAVLDAVSRDLGAGPIVAQDPGERGAGDISFVCTRAPLVSRRPGRDGRERPRSRRVPGSVEHANAHTARRVADVQAHSLTQGRAHEMHAPASSWIFLSLALLGLLMTATGLVRATRLGWGNMFWFLSGWLTSELALFHILLSAAVSLCFWWWSDAFHFLPAQFGLLILGVSCAGLLVTQWRSRPTERVLEHALVTGLGAGYRDSIPAPRRALLRDSIPFRELALPFALRVPGVEWMRNIAYADGGHERHVLDVYRPSGGCAGAPVLLQIHGGGWVVGNKHEQALPLVYHLAARGWIVVTANYRLSPKARFPDHLVDCKRAFAWIRANIATYGGDPSFVAVTGGSAGGHLTALMGLTANDLRLQPGFESVDTRVAACVPFYGVYDFVDRHGLKGSGAEMVQVAREDCHALFATDRPRALGSRITDRAGASGCTAVLRAARNARLARERRRGAPVRRTPARRLAQRGRVCGTARSAACVGDIPFRQGDALGARRDTFSGMGPRASCSRLSPAPTRRRVKSNSSSADCARQPAARSMGALRGSWPALITILDIAEGTT